MNIVFLNIYNGLVNRGSERSTHELASYLSKNHEVYLIFGEDNKKKTDYKTFRIHPFFPKHKDSSFSFWRKFYLDIWSLQIFIFTLQALPFLFRMHFDLIIPVNGGWQTVICRFLSWFQKSKMMIIGRAGIGRDDAWNLLWKPDIFVALTESAYSFAYKRKKNTQIICIPNGISLTEFHPDVVPVKLNLNKPIILCAGALNQNKRIDLVIKAVAKLKKASLLILGEGLQYQYLKKLGNELLGKKRFVITSVFHDEMSKYYTACKLFTLVSVSSEAFGNVYLEAMASNLPVVAADDQDRRKIIGKAGLFVKPENTNDYAYVLKKVLDGNYNNVPRIQAEKYSWEKVGKEYEKIIGSLSS